MYLNRKAKCLNTGLPKIKLLIHVVIMNSYVTGVNTPGYDLKGHIQTDVQYHTKTIHCSKKQLSNKHIFNLILSIAKGNIPFSTWLKDNTHSMIQHVNKKTYILEYLHVYKIEFTFALLQLGFKSALIVFPQDGILYHVELSMTLYCCYFLRCPLNRSG